MNSTSEAEPMNSSVVPFEHDAAPPKKFGSQAIRPYERFGDVDLSIQASKFHYSAPREDGLPLSGYRDVEVALFRGEDWLRPSDIGIEGYDDLWEPGSMPVAGYVAVEKVHELRALLRARAEGSPS